MRLDRLEIILEDWSRWMKRDTHRLGFPNRSILLSTGGESCHDAFDVMIEENDNKNVKIIDALIHSLPKNQKQAVYAQYLRTKKSEFHDRDYSLALDNLLTMADRRIHA